MCCRSEVTDWKGPDGFSSLGALLVLGGRGSAAHTSPYLNQALHGLTNHRPVTYDDVVPISDKFLYNQVGFQPRST